MAKRWSCCGVHVSVTAFGEGDVKKIRRCLVFAHRSGNPPFTHITATTAKPPFHRLMITLFSHIRTRLNTLSLIPRSVALTIVGLLVLSFGALPIRSDGPPTPEEYVAHVGNGARILKPGEFKLDGNRQWCGRRPVVIDDNLDDYGAAYPGFLIFNSKLMAQVSTPVKFWIFAHECAHQFRGPDEKTADCFAVQRGRRQGWLTIDGVEDICRFISPAKGSSMHFSGAHRCEYMRKCYTESKVH